MKRIAITLILLACMTASASVLFHALWDTAGTAEKQLWNPLSTTNNWYMWASANQSTFNLSADRVETWNDITTNAVALNVSVFLGSTNPVLGSVSVGTGNAVYFNGSAMLITSNATPSKVQTHTMAIAFVWDGDGERHYLFDSHSGASRAIVAVNWGGEISMFAGTQLKSGVVATAGVPYMVVAEFSGSSSRMFINGTHTVTGNAGTQDSGGYSIAGSTINNQTFRGWVYSLYSLRHALSEPDRQKLEGRMAWEHGFSVELPDVHPYKNEAPYDE